MRHRRFARTDLHRGDPRVLFKAAGNGDVSPLDHVSSRLGRDRELRTIDDDVRLNLPTVSGPFHRGGSFFRITLGGSRVSPARNGIDICLFERTVIRKVPVLSVREPGRHLACKHRALHGLRPRTGTFVAQERHGRRLAGTVAALAALLEQRLNVFVEGGGISCEGCPGEYSNDGDPVKRPHARSNGQS